MKKLSLSIVLVVAALLMTQCRKAGVQPVNGGISEPFGDFEMTLTAGNGDDKSSIEGLSIYWQLGDKLHVVDSNDMRYLGYLTATEIGDSKTTATFKGFITQPTVGHRCKFYFVGTNKFSIDDEGNYLFDVHEQYGGLSVYVGNVQNDDYNGDDNWKGGIDDVSNGLQLMKNRNKIEVTQAMLDAHNFGDNIIRMRSMMAIAHINLQVNGTSMGGELTDIVTVTGTGCIAKAKLNIKTGALTAVTGEKTITLKKANNDYYMVLIPENPAGSNLALTFTATSENGEELGITPEVQANKFYNKDGAMKIKMCETSEWICFNDPDMGVSDLPKWAKKNVHATNGSTKETWYGDYYAWGATTTWYSAGGQTSSPTWKDGYSDGYSWAHCPYTNGTLTETNLSVFTKYVPQDQAATYGYNGYYDTKTDLDLADPCDDAARANCGSPWRTPTRAEASQLLSNTYIVWTTNYNSVSGLNGYIIYKVKSASDKGSRANPAPSGKTYTTSDPHMFLPANGTRQYDNLNNSGSEGHYWVNSIKLANPSLGGDMNFDSSDIGVYNHSRCYGATVRPVR